MLHLLWEAFFLIGFGEMWRVESEASPWASTSAWYWWQQLMRLHLEVVGGLVGVDLSRFGAL